MEDHIAAVLGVPSAVIEPLDLADAKSYLSIRDTDTSQDAFLTETITMVRSMAEAYLHRYVITGTVQSRIVLAIQDMSSATVIRVKGPVRAVTSVTVTPPGGTSVSVDGAMMDEDRVVADLSDIDMAVARIDITYTVGSAVEYGIRTALLTMVRNRYDRRTEDPMTDDVMRMLRPYMRINI